MESIHWTSDETQRLRRGMRDLIALSTLPALWTEADRLGIAESLAEALQRMLSADFIYLRLRGPSGEAPVEAARVPQTTGPSIKPQILREALEPWLNLHGAATTKNIPKPLGNGIVRLVALPIGQEQDGGWIAAGSDRPDFPTETERLLLGVGVNQALIVLQRKKAEEALKQADRRKDEFLAMLAHELRNPLAPIRNALELIRLAGDDRTPLEEARGMMERQVAQLVRLTDDLLDVARITRGKIELRKERVLLTAVVNSAVEASRPLIQKRGHELTVTLPPEPIEMEADPTRLAQTVSNLLNNAAKYTDPGGHIWLTVQPEKDHLLLRVKDTGIGIPAEMLSRIFEMFTQVDQSLERAHGGLGIGLTLAKRLVEMHGGRIEARSEGLGRGSEFVVHLPILAPSSEQRQPSEPDAQRLSQTGRRILVVDDHEDSAKIMAMMLKEMGNEPRIASDGAEAIEVAEAFRPDVIFLDIGMPRLNGYDAARRIREQPWGSKILLVALTGWGQDEAKRRSREAGFDFHLIKPVDPAVLKRLLAGLDAAERST